MGIACPKWRQKSSKRTQPGVRWVDDDDGGHLLFKLLLFGLANSKMCRYTDSCILTNTILALLNFPFCIFKCSVLKAIIYTYLEKPVSVKDAFIFKILRSKSLLIQAISNIVQVLPRGANKWRDKS